MKYDIVFSCGHPGTVDLWGKGDERKAKIIWNETKGLCPDCHKIHKRADDIQRGLELHYEVLPDIMTDRKVEELKIWAILWFSGDTFPYKNEIQKSGFRWGENTAPSKVTNIHHSLCWSRIIRFDDTREVLNKLCAELPIKRLYRPANVTNTVEYRIANERLMLYHKKKDELLNNKPEEPDIIKGKYWNEHIYESRSSFGYTSFIYLNEQKVEIEEATFGILNKYIEDINVFRRDLYWLETGKLD